MTPEVRSKLAWWGDWLSSALLAVVVGLLAYRFLAPRPASPLGSLAGQPIVPPGQVTLVELSQTHCPGCWAMRPTLFALQKAFGQRVRVEVVEVDSPADPAEAERLSTLAALHFTPTLLVADAEGRATAKFIGPTSYASLASALDRALDR